jgi:hypothetical protein
MGDRRSTTWASIDYLRSAVPYYASDLVWSKNSCGAGIELEQSSEPLATLNDVAALFGFI